MQQQMSVVTLGVADLGASRRFYCDGFGWKPVFENNEIVFYQMNGFVLGTWLATALAPTCGSDMQRPGLGRPGAFALAHNVATRDEVQSTLDHLSRFGGHMLVPASAPPHGYIADPDDHAWEIAWNPAWPISPEGYVTFAPAGGP